MAVMTRARFALSSCALALTLGLPITGCGVGGAVRAVSSAGRAARGASRVARGTRAATKLGTRASTSTGRGASTLARVPLPVGTSDELARLAKLDEVDGVIDLAGYGLDGLDIVLASSEDEPEAPTHLLAGKAEPRYVEIESEAQLVQRMLEGEEDDHSPWVIVGAPHGPQSFELEGEAVSLARLAGGCWSVGLTCVFVSCSDQVCRDASHTMFEALVTLSESSPMSVPDFTEQYVRARSSSTEQWPSPDLVGVGGGLAGPQLQYLEPASP